MLCSCLRGFTVCTEKIFSPTEVTINKAVPPETEEEVISKLDRMDKEILECEQDIKNLETIEVSAKVYSCIRLCH